MYYKPITSEDQYKDYVEKRRNYEGSYYTNWENARHHYNALTVRIVNWNIQNDKTIITERNTNYEHLDSNRASA